MKKIILYFVILNILLIGVIASPEGQYHTFDEIYPTSINEGEISEAFDFRSHPIINVSTGLFNNLLTSTLIATDITTTNLSVTGVADVEGTVRIGTIDNALGDILTVSDLGVIQKRTVDDILDDIDAEPSFEKGNL
ncbi:MAG: hypothetical protein ACMXX8_01730, partial [Candidatus Woesearchaeota archaeon]